MGSIIMPEYYFFNVKFLLADFVRENPVKWTSLRFYRMIGYLNVATLMPLAPSLAFICPGFIFVPKLAFLARVLLPFFQDHLRTITISFIKYFSEHFTVPMR